MYRFSSDLSIQKDSWPSWIWWTCYRARIHSKGEDERNGNWNYWSHFPASQRGLFDSQLVLLSRVSLTCARCVRVGAWELIACQWHREFARSIRWGISWNGFLSMKIFNSYQLPKRLADLPDFMVSFIFICLFFLHSVSHWCGDHVRRGSADTWWRHTLLVIQFQSSIQP